MMTIKNTERGLRTDPRKQTNNLKSKYSSERDYQYNLKTEQRIWYESIPGIHEFSVIPWLSGWEEHLHDMKYTVHIWIWPSNLDCILLLLMSYLIQIYKETMRSLPLFLEPVTASSNIEIPTFLFGQSCYKITTQWKLIESSNTVIWELRSLL